MLSYWHAPVILTCLRARGSSWLHCFLLAQTPNSKYLGSKLFSLYVFVIVDIFLYTNICALAILHYIIYMHALCIMHYMIYLVYLFCYLCLLSGHSELSLDQCKRCYETGETDATVSQFIKTGKGTLGTS